MDNWQLPISQPSFSLPMQQDSLSQFISQSNQGLKQNFNPQISFDQNNLGPNLNYQQQKQYRDLDIMNLLLLGSMEKGQQRSGLEGISALYGGRDLINQNRSDFSQQNRMQQQTQQPYNNYQMSQPMPQTMDPYNQYNNYNQIPQVFNPNQNMFGQAGQFLMNPPVAGGPHDQIVKGDSNNLSQYIQKQLNLLDELNNTLEKQKKEKEDIERKELEKKLKDLKQMNKRDASFNKIFNSDYLKPMQSYSRPMYGVSGVGQQNSLFYPNNKQQPGYFNKPMIQPPYPHNQRNAQSNDFREQERLRVLALREMEKELMKESNKKQKRKRGQQSSFNDDSSNSDEEQSQYIIMARPKTPVMTIQVYDPQEDIKKLEALKSIRGKRNVKIFFDQFRYLHWYKIYLKDYLMEKRNFSQENMLDKQSKFMDTAQKWLTNVCSKQIEEIVKNKNLNFQIIEISNKKVSPAQKKKNCDELLKFTKSIIDQIYNNSDPQNIDETMMDFLSNICKERNFIPNSYFTKFELNRLNFTYHGALIQMNQGKCQMIICLSIFLKILIYRILSKPWMLQPGAPQITDTMKINCKTISSVIYQLLIQFIKIKTTVNPQNQKHIPMEYNITPAKETYKIAEFEPNQDEIKAVQEAVQQGLDEPLIYPLFEKKQLDSVFVENIPWVKELTQIIEGWSDSVYQRIKQRNDSEQNEIINQTKKIREEQKNKYLAKVAKITEIQKKNRDKFNQLNQDIQVLQLKIKQETEKNQNSK